MCLIFYLLFLMSMSTKQTNTVLNFYLVLGGTARAENVLLTLGRGEGEGIYGYRSLVVFFLLSCHLFPAPWCWHHVVPFPTCHEG